MKIAICSKGKKLNSLVDDRFGRTDNFIIIDTKTDNFTVIENKAKNEAGGAGGLAVRNLYNERVETVIVPQLGPKAVEALKAFEIKAFEQGEEKTVKEVYEKFKNNELKEMNSASVEEYSGLRRV